MLNSEIPGFYVFMFEMFVLDYITERLERKKQGSQRKEKVRVGKIKDRKSWR